MEMTIKQLANELGVSKPTIRNAVSELGLQGKLCKIGNRYMLSDDQIMKIKLQISEKSKNEVLPKSEKTEKSESEVLPKSEKTESEVSPKSKKTEKSKNDIWREQLAVKDGQIKLLQEQLIVKDRQINLLQEQISQLTSAMESMATALTASQALHAGTIQKQLTEYSTTEQSTNEMEQPKQKQGLFSRLLEKRQRKSIKI